MRIQVVDDVFFCVYNFLLIFSSILSSFKLQTMCMVFSLQSSSRPSSGSLLLVLYAFETGRQVTVRKWWNEFVQTDSLNRLNNHETFEHGIRYRGIAASVSSLCKYVSAKML